MKEMIMLVDENDRALGTMDKMAAHVSGRLHRALSVFVFNSDGELLLQQRAFGKYHSGGKWSNTCCSHPKPGETVADAARRRLQEEMGMECALEHRFSFTYQAQLDNGITEHEFDHVFFGLTDQMPQLNPAEAAAFRYVKMDALRQDLEQQPQLYSAWLNTCFTQVMEVYLKMFDHEQLVG